MMNKSPDVNLLDHFAGQALIGLLAGKPDTGSCFDPEGEARRAYELAKAMANERKRVHTEG